MTFEKDLGKVGLTTAGTWSSTASYERLTVVTWRGRSYLSKITNKNVEPGTNTDVWQLIAEKGADGQGGGGGGGDVTTDIGVARYSDGFLYWTKNGVWLLDEYGNKVKAQGVDGKDGKDGKDGEGGGSGGGGGDAISKFKSYVFVRSQTAPATPRGGSFDNPVPTGWYDGIPPGELQVWTSSRWFYSDDSLTAQTEWSAPVATTDTAEINFEFSSFENPGNPNTNPGYWHDPAEEGDKWMAIQVIRNGRPQGWSIIRIVGEDGKDGKDGASFNILGSYDTIEEAEIAHPDPSRNDVVIIDGTLYIWDGEQWANMGVESTIGMFLDSYVTPIPGTEDTAKAGSFTVNPWAQRGSELINATIGTITGIPTGMTVSLSNNGTDHPSFTFTVTTSLTTPSGQLTIPLSAGGETHYLKHSWVISFSGPQGQKGDDGYTGQDGYNTVNLMLYKRVDTNPSASMPGSVTYTFSTDSISTPANGWQRTPPSNDGDPLWMVQGTASTREDEVTISSWNGPVKFVENGFPGKTMRGPSLWRENVNYQGLGTSDSSFVDLVYLNENYATLYYAKQNNYSTQANKPGQNTETSQANWAAAEVQDFVATKVFYSDLGFVDNLGVRNVLINDFGSIIGGFMPANTNYDASDPQVTNGNTLLWIGGPTPTSPSTAFQIDKFGNGTFSGVVNASSGKVGPYTIGQDGIAYQDTSSIGDADFYGAGIYKEGAYFGKGDPGGESTVYVNTSRNGDTPLVQLYESGRGAPAVSIETGFISGFRLKVRTGGSSDLSLWVNDNILIFNNSTTRTVTLPPGGPYFDGHIIAIVHTTSSTLRVASGGTGIVQVLSNGASEVSVAESGRPETMLFVYSHALSRWYLTFLKSS